MILHASFSLLTFESFFKKWYCILVYLSCRKLIKRLRSKVCITSRMNIVPSDLREPRIQSIHLRRGLFRRSALLDVIWFHQGGVLVCPTVAKLKPQNSDNFMRAQSKNVDAYTHLN